MRIVNTNNSEIISKLNEHVHSIHVQLYPDYFKEYNYNDIKEFFDKIINKDNFIFLLIEDDNISVGYVWIELKEIKETAFTKFYKIIFIHQLCIINSHRKMGYGTKLMEKIYDIARANKIHKVQLDYWSANETAESFYEKHGFIEYRNFVYKEI